MVDPGSGEVVRRVAGVGEKSHGLVFWDKVIVMLDSDHGALMTLDPATGNTTRLWQVKGAGGGDMRAAASLPASSHSRR